MAHFDKELIMDGVRAELAADTTIASWAGMIATRDGEVSDPEIAAARSRGNFVFVRDGGGIPESKSTSTRIWAVRVHIAICAGRPERRMDGSGRSVMNIEDDIRRVMTDNRTFYSAPGVQILEATITNTPPTATVWSELFEQAAQSGFRMAVVELLLRIFERR